MAIVNRYGPERTHWLRAGLSELRAGLPSGDTAGRCASLFLALVCVCAAGTVTPVLAGREGQQTAGDGPGSPDAAAALASARRLQEEADQHLEKREIQAAADKTERALAIRRQYLGERHSDVAVSLNQLGNIAYLQGQYERAETLIGGALNIREATLGPDHVDVAQSLTDLAAMLQVRGDYVKPEPLYRRALSIYLKALSNTRTPPPSDVQDLLAATLTNLGRLYSARGDYKNAESRYREVLAIRERAGRADDRAVADALADVGGVYYSSGQYGKAVTFLERARAIQQKALPPNHPSLATSSHNLAAVYFDQGKYPQAEELFKQALDVDEQAFGPQNPRVAIRLVALAEVLRLEGEYARAEPLYERALTIRERALGPTHPDVATTLYVQSLLQNAAGRFGAATDLLTRSANLREDTLALVLTTGSEEQKRLYLSKLADETDVAVSLHLGSAPSLPAAARLALTAILQRKGRSLDATVDQIAVLRRHLDEGGREILNQLSATRSRLATMVMKGVSSDGDRRAATTLRGEIEQLEQTIGARSAEFRTSSQRATLPDIQASLPDRAALIEFFWYRPFLVHNPRDTAFGPPRYAAYVLRANGIAGSADLGEAALIEDHVRRFRSALANPGDQGVRKAGRALYLDVIAPLLGSLADVDRIVVSPDGALNLAPFSALVGENDQYLVERFTISYVTSGRDLIRFGKPGPVPSRTLEPPVIVANPSFDGRLASRRSPDRPAGTRAFDARLLEQTRHFEPLPGTGQEAAALARVMPDARIYTGAEATEALLKTLNGPSILHIATHGFFLRPVSPPSYTAAGRHQPTTRTASSIERDDALVLSGLALAGVNQRSSGDGNDGLLTAREVAGLDLWGTRLVVLSACETGIGDVRNGEGVYGLRRALVLAGSESQVMSLWQVSDVATRDLMTAYYQRLRSHEGRAEALRQVQIDMLRGKASQRHPFFWAGFIQSGDWRPAFD